MNKLKAVPAGNWRPSKWSEFVGNYQITQYFKDMIWSVRKGGASCGFNALLIGESGSGKTASTEYAMKCVGCLDLDFVTLDACGKCYNCRQDIHLFGHQGWENAVDWLDEDDVKTPIRYKYTAVDCPNLKPAELEKILYDLPASDDMRQFITLDEVHCLSRNGMDDKLLKAMDDYPVNWIAMSACLEQDQSSRQKLEQMLINRFTYVLSTENPDNDEDLMRWSVARSQDFQISIETPEKTLGLLVQRSRCVIRDVLKLLKRAQNSRDRVLTLKMVEDCIFLK